MCRFVLYLGREPVLLSSLLTEPDNSLINQSLNSSEGHFPFNGDGFGIAWYAPEIRPEPGRFRSLQPAWSNQNLHGLAGVIRSHCLLAHVRAATPGLPVSDANCHPFLHKTLAFMHNGMLAGFGKLRQELVASLTPYAYAGVTGSTDSEHVFAVFIDELALRKEATAIERAAAALQATVNRVLAMAQAVVPGEASFLNLAVTDGDNAVLCRVTDGDPEGARSLYIHTDEPFQSEAGEYAMLAKSSTLVSSERLNEDPGWECVPPNHMVLIERGKGGRLKRMTQAGPAPEAEAKAETQPGAEGAVAP